MVKLSFNLVLSRILMGLICLLSFRAFAGFLTPDFDSDQAVHVLMAYDLQLPEDLYYWGQSRLGSLLPILSHWLLNVLPFSPIEAVSYVQYGFLIIGFLCCISLFKSIISKIVFTLIWFLPANPFIKLVAVAHPYAPQFALLGIALTFTNKLASSNAQINKIISSFIITSCLMLSIWVSELSLIPVLLAAVLWFGSVLQRQKWYQNIGKRFNPYLGNSQAASPSPIDISVACSLILWSAFLVYAKTNASQEDVKYGFLEINSLDTILEILHSVVASIVNSVLFQVGHPGLSLYTTACIGLITVLTRCFLQMRRSNHLTPHTQWIPFLLLSAIGTLLLILLSRWTYIQDTPSRYFISIYIFCWLSALLVFDNLEQTNFVNKTILRRISIALVLTALLGSFSLPGYVFALAKPQSQLSNLQPLASLGKAGFIGEYWTSYLMCIAAPDRLSCTPHDQDFARCPRCVEHVLESPTIYLVSRDWLTSFPEAIEQFGQRLQQQQPAKKIDEYWIAPYRNVTQYSD